MNASMRSLAYVTVLLAAGIPAFAQNDAHREAHAPNVDIEVHQRIFPTGEKPECRVSLYNTKKVVLTVYAVDLAELAPNAFAISESDADKEGSLPWRLKRLDLTSRRASRRVVVTLKDIYEDSWRSKDIELPGLHPGVYVLRAVGGGVEARTWLAVSNRALLCKRSPETVLGWLVNARTGQPVAGSWVALYDRDGKVAAQKTERDGTVVFASPSERDICWMTATGGDPTFVQPSAPRKGRHYEAFVYTDRPIYRPGHLIKFRGTVREVMRGQYRVPKEGENVTVEIKFSGDPVYRKELPLNDWGSFAGRFQLAPEPPLGRYDLMTTVGSGPSRTTFYKSFEVEAYRKPEFEPEVSIPQTHYLQGATIPVTISADYFFGSPVSGGKVEYEVDFWESGGSVPQRVRDAAGLGTTESMRIEDGFTGEDRLDAEGKLVLEVPTRYATSDRTMRVEATVSELALRPRTASASTLITAANFRLSVNAGWDYIVGEEVPIEVEAEDYDGKPVSTALTVEVIETKVDREGRYYEERTKFETETDGNGEATVVYKPERPGRFEIEVWAKDDEGNPVYDDDYFYVEEKREEEKWPSLSMSADKSRYATGDTALIHTETDQRGAWMLVTVEGEMLYDYKVHRILANEFDLKVPILDEHKPESRVRAYIIRDGDRISDYARLNVPHDERRLEVIVTPDAEVYEPGQQSIWTVLTRSLKGRGVASEVGVGVVDEALYAIREDDTPDPFDVFWGDRALRVTTDFSHTKLYPGGGAQGGVADAATAAPAPMEEAREAEKDLGDAADDGDGIRVRRRFADTAYWSPSVITGPDGSAQVSFEMPDNLTTWRATARAIARDTSAGETTTQATVTMPLLVRMVVPRFYVAEDEGTAAAIVHNYTGEEKSVEVTLTGTGITVQGEPQQTITVPADGIQRLTWRVSAVGPDEGVLLVSADGGPGAQDAVETRLPILPSGVKNVDGYAGSSDGNVTQEIPLPADAIAGESELVVTLSPSLAGPIFEALDYLTHYPYGCAEQTMDSFLPDVIVARTLARLDAPREKPEMLDRYVSFGLQKLMRYQHDDGGWHWWEFDESDPYISAYVVYGLKIADEAGYVAARAPMRRGVQYLVRALQEEDFRQAQAYLLWALAYADVWSKSSWDAMTDVLVDLNDNRDKLDMFSRASLGLAVHRLADEVTDEWKPQLTQYADEIATELEEAAIVEGTSAHWSAEGQAKYSWLNNDVEVTCQVLRLLLEVKPDSDRIEPAVRWLMVMRRGKHWRSTKDTAAAVLALTAYLEQSSELSPGYTATVSVGGKQAGNVTVSSEDIFADPKTFTVPAEDLVAGVNQLQITKDGQGMVYWSARLSYLIPAATAVPTTDDMVVERIYRVPAEDPTGAGTQQPGDVVTVSLQLTVKEDIHYAMLEEPIPAGCEVISGDDSPWGKPWDRREVWDNRIVFFFDYLPRGMHEVSYVLRTEAPGLYNILPSTASLMYFPEVRGHNRLVRMRVADVTED
jgi:uncharacterized protein YfaS (alpha-2-macroglobulin family)